MHRRSIKGESWYVVARKGVAKGERKGKGKGKGKGREVGETGHDLLQTHGRVNASRDCA